MRGAIVQVSSKSSQRRDGAGADRLDVISTFEHDAKSSSRRPCGCCRGGSSDKLEILRLEKHVALRVARAGIEPQTCEHHVRHKPQHSRDDHGLRRERIGGKRRASRQRDVHRGAASFPFADGGRAAGVLGEQPVRMDRYKEDIWPGQEDLFRAVAMMDVPIQDADAQPSPPQAFARDGDVVEHAIATRSRRLSMMAGWPHYCEDLSVVLGE